MPAGKEMHMRFSKIYVKLGVLANAPRSRTPLLSLL